ncbi:Hypothetical predicted protein [Pelobates cultripes]|nr:Hypothetical predicted protein [Pelobates cultripes]
MLYTASAQTQTLMVRAYGGTPTGEMPCRATAQSTQRDIPEAAAEISGHSSPHTLSVFRTGLNLLDTQRHNRTYPRN